jgi:hypothetical protein
MALQAGGVDVGHAQKLRISAAVWRVTGRATRLPDGFVFVHPGASHVSVAFEARGDLVRDGCLQALLKGAVRVVADGALDWTVVGFVMNRRGELGFNGGVAVVAKHRLRCLQQPPFFAGMDGMTTGAPDVRCSVSRLGKFRVLPIVAGEAARVRVFG